MGALRIDGFGADGGATPPASTKFKTMEQILISVETIQQRDKVVEVLENAAQDSLHHVGGELDFPLDIWKLHRSDASRQMNDHPDVTT